MILAWLAAVATMIGATCLYASTTHQALLGGVAHARPLRWSGAVLLTIALAILLGIQGPATAVFTWITEAMLVWSIVPVAARWWRFRREQGK